MPTSSVPTSAIATPSRKLPVHAVRVAAKEAPIMYSEPCARLTRSMIPNTSVNPAASMNSSRPHCRPLRHCSMKRVMARRLHICAIENGGSARAPPPSFTAPASVRRHLAFRVMTVLEVLDDRGGCLPHELVAFLDPIIQIEVLDRNVIRSELEAAAHRLEIGLFERLTHRVLV